jgi:alkylation response protein AidB-like acyl-CoA dehydrogenase
MKRVLYEDEHLQFQESFRAFLKKHVASEYMKWEAAGRVPREIFSTAGDEGFLAFEVPAHFGGVGIEDFRFNAAIGEEARSSGFSGLAAGITLHNDICIPYLMTYCTDDQKQRWLPGVASGDLLCAIALTEPGTGSDLASMLSSGERVDGGYKVNGSKTFISNGLNSDLIITAVRTDKNDRHGGLTLMVIEGGAEGLERGRNLDKIGMHSQDTAELFFNDIFVPEENVLGQEGDGFTQLVSNLPRERLSIAIAAISSTEGVIRQTVEYVTERKVFGRPVGSFQNSKFVLASIKAEADVMRTYVDRCTVALTQGELTADEAAIAKLCATEFQGRAVDSCLQLFGGYGYMTEYPVARAFVDARVSRILGGTSEIMKAIIGKSMGL